MEHRFEDYELFPVSKVEKAEGDRTEAEALSGWKELGPEVYRKKLEEANLGLTDDELAAASAAQPSVSPIDQILGRRAITGE